MNQKRQPLTRIVADHLDMTTIDDFLAIIPGKPDILIRIIETFLRTSPHFLGEIGAAIKADDPVALQKAAHTMKSSNAQLGALQLAAMCHELELMGKMGSIIDGAGLMAKMEEECRSVEMALTDILGQLRTY